MKTIRTAKLSGDDLIERYRKDPIGVLEETCPGVEDLVAWLREFFAHPPSDPPGSSGFPTHPAPEVLSHQPLELCFKGVVGLSGGLDSSVVAGLAVQSLGKENVHGLLLPSQPVRGEGPLPDDVRLGLLLARELGIAHEIISIEPFIEAGGRIRMGAGEGKGGEGVGAKDERGKVESSGEVGGGYFSEKIQMGNLQARARMIMLYDLAKQVGGVVIGTSNYSEYMTGYFTKHGDGGVDLEPLLPLYKTQVRKIARELGVPKEIIDRSPTAGLWEGQTDEDEMGISYELLDAILLGMDLGLGSDEIIDATGADEGDIVRVEKLICGSAHKRTPPPAPGPWPSCAIEVTHHAR